MTFPRCSTVTIVTALLVGACAGESDDALARSEIEAAIARGVEATRVQDIDAYMALIPEDAVLYDDGGAVVTRDALRANALRDWSIIPRTLSISAVVDSIARTGDTAIVHTFQRWERLMLRRDGVTADTVLTTQGHREVWRKTRQGWFGYEVEELGGEVFINGERYQPEG
jgi:ketosteroid isomerase-like protein